VILLSVNTPIEIKTVILDLINKISHINKNKSHLKYDLITMETLEKYSIN
jgi:hypothetical protein